MKFLIIGGDAAGMSAASRAKRKKTDMEVTVLEQTMDVSYSACGMPYNIADPDRDMEKLVVRKAEVFIEKNKINLLTGHKAEKIDPINKLVTGVDINNNQFSFPYDKLLIATGASPIIPEIPGFNLPEVMALKSLEHGKKIKAFIEQKNIKKAVILGMGYIGLEMCEALTKRSVKVDMIKPRPVFLPWMTPELADVIKNELEANNINLFLGHKIERIEPDKKGLSIKCDDFSIDADLVIVAIGVTPNSDIAIDAGIKTGISNAISVDSTLLTSDKDIYAAGDCADAIHVVTKKKCWIPLALRANRAGWAVADNLCGLETKLKGVAGTAVFKVFSLEVARTGLSTKEALDAGFDPAEISIKTRSRAHGQPGSKTIYVSMTGDKKTGQLLGVQMVGKEGVAHRINAAAVALHSNMTVKDFSETDLAYAPPFGPVWDPLLTAANQLIKKL